MVFAFLLQISPVTLACASHSSGWIQTMWLPWTTLRSTPGLVGRAWTVAIMTTPSTRNTAASNLHGSIVAVISARHAPVSTIAIRGRDQTR